MGRYPFAEALKRTSRLRRASATRIKVLRVIKVLSVIKVLRVITLLLSEVLSARVLYDIYLALIRLSRRQLQIIAQSANLVNVRLK